MKANDFSEYFNFDQSVNLSPNVEEKKEEEEEEDMGAFARRRMSIGRPSLGGGEECETYLK